MHLVEVACTCDNIEACRMERYISDVRILVAENDSLRRFELRVIRFPDADASPPRGISIQAGSY